MFLFLVTPYLVVALQPCMGESQLKKTHPHISFRNNTDVTFEKCNKKRNFWPKEWTELRNVMNQPAIIIKEADKEGAVTVLSKN